MKILFLSHQFYPCIGGIEVNSEILAGEFYKAGHEIKLLTWTKEKGQKEFPYPVIRQPNLPALLREHTWADVVYENNPCLRLAWPAIFFTSTSVIALRTWINRKQDKAGLADKLKVFWLKRASAVIAISEAVRKQCWPKAVVIGNPYRDGLFKRKDSLQTGDFAFLGRLVSDKGADIAVEAIHILKTKYNKAYSLTIIGDGPEKSSLQEKVVQKDLSSQVHFSGNQQGENLVNTLNHHRYLLVPSLWEEPFGNVALEGMACGCIPIVSDGGGLPDAVGDAGVVCKRGDVDEWVGCIEKITGDANLQKRLHANASAHLKNHTPEVVAKRYLDVIVKASRNR